MKRCITFAMALIFSFFAATSGAQLYAADKNAKKEAKKEKTTTAADSKNKAAVVNGTTISRSSLDSEVSRYEQQMKMMGQSLSPEQAAEMKKKVLESMVNRELLWQECKKLGLKASDEEVNQQIGALKSKLPGEADFTAMLTKLNVTEADFKAEIGKDMTLKKFIELEIAPKVTVTGEESKSFYDSHPDLFKMPERARASHILVKVDKNATKEDKEKAQKKAKDIQKRIKKGEDFATVAKEVSDCPSKANGGDLNYFAKGKMDPTFENAAFALSPGQVSDIVETQFGYHIIKLTDKKEAGIEPYDKVKDVLEKRMKQDKIGQQVSQYIDQLRAKGKVETFVN